MDTWTCLYPPPDSVLGVQAAIRTVFFAGLPLALLGIWLPRLMLRRTTAAPPLPDALHSLARFALVLIALNVCLLAPVVGSFAVAMLLDLDAWPFSLFMLLFVIATSTAAAFGALGWTDVLRRTAQTRMLSLARPIEW